jgi:hypothetical protein
MSSGQKPGGQQPASAVLNLREILMTRILTAMDVAEKVYGEWKETSIH